MSCNHLNDCLRCADELQELEDRIEQLKEIIRRGDCYACPVNGGCMDNQEQCPNTLIKYLNDNKMSK